MRGRRVAFHERGGLAGAVPEADVKPDEAAVVRRVGADGALALALSLRSLPPGKTIAAGGWAT
jgi:hypothetical protein